MTPRNGGPTKSSHHQAETDDKISTLKNYKNFTKLPQESYDNNRRKNQDCRCPYKCGTCDLLKEYVKSRYEVVNILEDDSKLIFNPLI